MKKILIIIALIATLASCNEMPSETSVTEHDNAESSTFRKLERVDLNSKPTYIIYDTETGVMYLVIPCVGGIEMLRNADGTPKLYKGYER